MTPKVSIIVPIYNAGKFLEKCLDTLVNQTLKDIEIILVLDCPTDGSDRIAREYAEKDPRIRLIINEQNLNIGLSRNEGLKIARGEYIGFSDHDDWRELDMYEKLYQKAREDQADIAISNFDSIYPDRIIPHPYYPDCPNQEQLKQEIFSHLIGDWKKEQEWRPFTHWGYMWHILYKREILENHNIWFSDNREITYEDLLFLIQVFHAANRITCIPLILYHHVFHQKNQASSYIYNSTRLVINHLMYLDHFLTTHHLRDEHLWDYFFSTLHVLWRTLKNEIHHKSCYQAFIQLVTIRKNPTIRQLVREVPFSVRMARKLKIQKTVYVKIPVNELSKSSEGREIITNVTEHKVKSGEPLAVIASKYGVTVNLLKEWNNLSSSRIQVGQRLKVSGEDVAKTQKEKKVEENVNGQAIEKYK